MEGRLIVVKESKEPVRFLMLFGADGVEGDVRLLDDGLARVCLRRWLLLLGHGVGISSCSLQVIDGARLQGA